MTKRGTLQPEPEFQCIRNVEFRTILSKDIYTENILNNLGLTERHKEVIKYIKEKGRITNKEYRNLYSLSDEGARLDIQKIIKKGILKPVGKGKNIHYVLNDEKLGE
ncbi:MAG: DeoR family transcriptional regulator [Bacteroidetes bacterium]|nr:DeoR family transcriptional regulator [Bacteroidota bacterium]